MAFELGQPEDDGLYVPEVGPWSTDKHHFLKGYIDAFTTAMRDKGWAGLHYIDLFAGAGIERIKGGGLDWGSPLVAAQVPNRFTQLHLCELEDKRFDALVHRVQRFPQPNPPRLFHADCNSIVPELVRGIPDRCLSLAFLDPYGLHLHFQTLVELSKRRADLIIFFPDHLDALRNWENVYKGNPDSNLDRVLGTPWLEQMLRSPQDRWADVLTSIYVRQIRTLRYEHFEYERISMTGGRFLYKLIFCSLHPAGAKTWRGISKTKSDGQRSLF